MTTFGLYNGFFKTPSPANAQSNEEDAALLASHGVRRYLTIGRLNGDIGDYVDFFDMLTGHGVDCGISPVGSGEEEWPSGQGPSLMAGMVALRYVPSVADVYLGHEMLEPWAPRASRVQWVAQTKAVFPDTPVRGYLGGGGIDLQLQRLGWAKGNGVYADYLPGGEDDVDLPHWGILGVEFHRSNGLISFQAAALYESIMSYHRKAFPGRLAFVHIDVPNTATKVNVQHALWTLRDHGADTVLIRSIDPANGNVKVPPTTAMLEAIRDV